VNDSTLRAWWSHRQGLDGSLRDASPADVLERAGWARSVGGAGPYLTLFARATISRDAADAAAARLDVHELPAARNCTYVVPSRDFALALAVGAGFSSGEMKTALKIGVTDTEVDRLCDAVLGALSSGPLEPEAIRAATGNRSRSLGDVGKKKGMSTTLPLALGRLQAEGAIRRVPVNGRLDQQRYAYTLWQSNPLAGAGFDGDAAFTELARSFFEWIGPARRSEFRWFSGLGARLAEAAVAPLGLEPAWNGSDLLMLPGHVEAFRSFRPPGEPCYVLVSSLDSIAALRRDLRSLLGGDDGERVMPGDRLSRPMAVLSDLPGHAILDRGRVIGLWEYDTASESIVWMTFGVRDPAIEAAVRATADFIREQLGDARSFSLDSPKSRSPRIEAIRAAAG
jgi:DNA glycosylase AlkZ-like